MCRLRNYLFLITVLSVFLSSCHKQASKEVSRSKPNIIFILADDLGYGDLGCYGQDVIQTPNIDKMAEEGMKFTQFYAGGPVCTSSRAVLMTGLNNGNSQIKTMEKSLGDAELTLGEMLKKAGYTTGVIGKWGMGGVESEGLPNYQGFDYSYGYYSHIRAHNSYPDYLYENGEKDYLDNEVIYIKDSTHYAVGIGNAATEKNTFSNQKFTEKGLEFIEKSSRDPFFLYMAYTIPHANNESWLTGDCGMEVPDNGIYANEDWPEAKKAGASLITLLDQYVADIMDKLKEEGIDDNTIVIFSSDNGPHGEGGWRPDFFDSNSIYRGMKRDMYEGGIRVPFIVWCPNKIQPGVSTHMGAFWDMMPTFCEMADIDAPKTDGVSIVPTLEGNPSQEEHESFYWEFRTSTLKQAVRKGDWKAIRVNENGKPFPVELYNINTDVVEEYNVADDHKDVVLELENIMNIYN